MLSGFRSARSRFSGATFDSPDRRPKSLRRQEGDVTTSDSTVTDDGDGDASDIAAASEKPVRLADGNELDAFVAAHDLALVDLYTEGCTLCAAIEPVMGNVASATDAAVATLNPRDDPVLVERYDVRSVPTLLLFADGELVDRLAEGFRGTRAVVEFVENRGE